MAGRRKRQGARDRLKRISGSFLFLAAALSAAAGGAGASAPPGAAGGDGGPTSHPPTLQWFPRTSPGSTRAVGLVLHGLNLNPERMQPVIEILNETGVDVLRPSLRGHGGNFANREGMGAAEARLEAIKSVSYNIWRAETLAAWREARQQALRQGVPLVLVGYSLGGLLGLDLLASQPGVAFDRAILFAPAVSLNGWDYLIRVFSPFPRLVVPTLAPRRYLANHGTPMAAYNALFEALDHFEAHSGPRLNLPALVFIDPRDELVSFDGMQRLAAEASLDRWRFFPVAKSDTAAPGALHHILIDADAVGAETWETMRRAMAAHLAAEAPR